MTFWTSRTTGMACPLHKLWIALIWGDGIRVDLVPDLTTSRKDRPIRRRGWQFGDRTEYQAFSTGGLETCISA